MKVLHVLPNVSRSFGGPTESLIGYAQAAGSVGIEVDVAAPRPPSDDIGWLRSQTPDTSFRFFKSAGRHSFVVSVGLWTWLASGASRQYDLVHVHGLFNLLSSVSSLICCLQGRPLLIRPFGTLSRYTFSRRRLLKQIYFRLLDRPALRCAAGVHFTTTAEKEEASRLSLSLDGRAHVVPPPLRGKELISTGESRSDQPTVLFLSRLHPKKNLSGLFDAWQHVVNDHSEARLWIAGDGDDEYVTELEAQVRRLGLNEQVTFLGFIQGEEKKRVLQKAWAFVLPSHQENLGIAVLESIAAGLPVVISPEVQIKSFVETHELGHVVPRDETALATALTSTLEDASLQRHVANRGPEAVRETFSVDVVGTQLAEMYADVAQIGNRQNNLSWGLGWDS